MDLELGAILDRLRKKAEEKRDRARGAADAEFMADMQSITRLESLDSEVHADTDDVLRPSVVQTPDDSDPNSRPSFPKRVGGRKNGPTAAVREAIQKLGNGFSVASLADHFAKSGPPSVNRAAIYSALNKLSEGNEIERMPSPDGKRSTDYKIVRLKEVT